MIVLVALQENGTDRAPQSLRALLQSVETSGVVDYTIGGHTCSRPAEVKQGKAPDSFEIQPDESNPCLWRPQAIQQKNLKGANVASHFSYPLLKASPLVLAPWT